MLRAISLALLGMVSFVAGLSAQSDDLQRRLSAATQGAADAKYELRYRLKAGEVIRWSTVQQANTITRIESVESHDRCTTETVKVWRIRSVAEDGSIVLEQSIERLTLAQSIGDGEEIRFDSQSSEAPPLRYESIAKTVGVPLTLVTIRPDGEVVSKEAIYQDVQMGMDDVAVPLPKEPIAIGGEWYTPSEFVAREESGSAVKIRLRKNYRLESVTRGVATISMKTEVMTPVESPRLRSQLIQEMTQGTIRFDLERGLPISKEMKWDEEVVGFSSPQSFMEFHGRFDEKLSTEGAPETSGEDSDASPAPAVGSSSAPAEATPARPSVAREPEADRNTRLRTRDGKPILRK